MRPADFLTSIAAMNERTTPYVKLRRRFPVYKEAGQDATEVFRDCCISAFHFFLGSKSDQIRKSTESDEQPNRQGTPIYDATRTFFNRSRIIAQEEGFV
jgi:hypothetical protein